MCATGISGNEVSVHFAKASRRFPLTDDISYELAIRKAIEIASPNKDLIVMKNELKVHYNQAMVPMLKPFIKSEIELEKPRHTRSTKSKSGWN